MAHFQFRTPKAQEVNQVPHSSMGKEDTPGGGKTTTTTTKATMNSKSKLILRSAIFMALPAAVVSYRLYACRREVLWGLNKILVRGLLRVVGRFLQGGPLLGRVAKRMSIWQNNPLELTVPARHFWDIRRGKCGVVVLDGWVERFNQVLALSGDRIAVPLSLRLPFPGWCIEIPLGLCAPYTVHTRRIDSLSTLHELEFDDDSTYDVPTLSTIDCSVETKKGVMFVKGVIDEEGTPCVLLQYKPFVGCRLSTEVLENMRVRTGEKPNLGYMEFNIKKLKVNPEFTVPVLAEFLTAAYRPLNYEPYVESKSEGGEGDVVADIAPEDGSFMYKDPFIGGKILPAILDKDSCIIAATRAAEELSYKERVLKYQDPNFEVPEKYRSYAQEFLPMVCSGLEGSLRPLSEEEVLERQNRPAQLRDYREVAGNCYDDDPQIKTFQKGEVYGPKIPPPRIISNPQPTPRVLTAAYIYPLYDTLKSTNLKHVIGFGNSEYVAECFNKVEQQAFYGDGTIDETDFTKLDANVKQWLRDIELQIGLILYHADFHEQYREVHKAQYSNVYPKTAKGTRMEMGATRRSGEGGTSFYNSVPVNMFWAYCVYREMGHKPVDAFLAIGIVGGDDGLHSGMSKEVGERVGAEMGLPVKICVKTFGEEISFLGIVKIAPGVEVYSCDVLRWVTKAPYSHVKNVPWQELAYRKCEPYLRYYGNVPLVGNYCKAVLRILAFKYSKDCPDNKYDELCRGQGYMLSMLDGPLGRTDDELAGELLAQYVCKTLKLTMEKLGEICMALDKANDFKEFPKEFIGVDVLGKFDYASTAVFQGVLCNPAPGESKLPGQLSTGLPRTKTGSNEQEKAKAETNEESERRSTVSARNGDDGSTCREEATEKKKVRKRRRKRKDTNELTNSRGSGVPKV